MAGDVADDAGGTDGDRDLGVRGGCVNLRDVGGPVVPGGAVVRRGVLLRGDAPLAGDPPPGLRGWPPATVIDLRSPDEREEPHPLAGVAEVHVLPLSVEARLDRVLDGLELTSGDPLAPLYARILELRGDVVAEGVALMARSRGPVLVHCAAGKDRTGILVAAVLAAVGVPDDAVVDDYLRTGANMPAVLRRVAEGGGNREAAERIARYAVEAPAVVGVSAPAIRGVLGVFAAAGGAGAWLHRRGVSRADLDALGRRLVGAGPGDPADVPASPS